MLREKIEARLHYQIVDRLGLESGAVTPSAAFIDDLGIDSLDAIELLMAAEEEFDVEISDAAAAKVWTVKDAADLIEQLLEGQC